MKTKLLALVLLITIVIIVIAVILLHPTRALLTVDYKNRTSLTVMPPLFFGAGGVGTTMSYAEGIKEITSINLLGNRIFVQVNSIYATSTSQPNYSALDGQLERATRDGLRPIVVIQGTPPDLGPSQCSMPQPLDSWVKIATEVVKHIEQRIPNKASYEVWNEPDAQNSFCDPNALNDYLTLYAAAAKAFKEAAPTALIGGPTLAAPGPNMATWIPAFLSSAGAPYVDFVSFHVYITGQWDIDQGMDWSYLYNVTQSPTKGLGYYYRTFESYVRKGNQPNAATTPIYITEYNVNHIYNSNCCQNSPVYGPLWNATVITDFMNSVNEGATMPPSRISYFNASDAAGYFCVLGTLTDSMDCKYPGSSGTSYQRYPQFAAYEMFTSTAFLNLETTGANVVATPIVPDGLIATAFYTPTADSIVIVNPTKKGYPAAQVNLQNTGLQSMAGERYMLTGGMLLKTPQPIQAIAKGSVSTLVNIPPYSTVSISLVQP